MNFVKKISDNMPQIKEGITAIGNFIVDTAIAIAEVALILKDLFTGNFKGAFDRLSKFPENCMDNSVVFTDISRIVEIH